MLNILIMAGGKGERFWPKSRIHTPKQLLNLTGNGSMIQETVRRVRSIAEPAQIHIITNVRYVESISRQLPEIPEQNIILEPEGKNTAPCIGLAALVIGAKDPNGIMAVLASDHIIKDEAGFCRLLLRGAGVAAATGGVVTLGVKPDRPETGYGYIKLGEPCQGFPDVYQAERFIEKPNLEAASEFVATGSYLWNSGIFIWNNAVILELIAKYMPDLDQGLQIIKAAFGKPDYDEVLRREYANFEKISVDYGIMEHTPLIYVLPADIGWDDVGSWTSLEQILPQDEQGNIVTGENVILIDTDHCIITSEDKLITAIGLKDLIYVETADAVLICPKHRAQDVKLILEKLRVERKEEYL